MMTRRSRRTSAGLLLALALSLTACTIKEDAAGGQGIPAPSDVAAPPKAAQVTASGLASRILRNGLSSVHPSPRSRVTVLYTGWTTDGKMFETTEGTGHPLGPFPLTDPTSGKATVIQGWLEGLQLMVVGEKRRFWIPSDLAYNNAPGQPQGMLVFDVELLEVR
jgi:FKBP-type peptidyl-prolyl cis-trans isomerase